MDRFSRAAVRRGVIVIGSSAVIATAAYAAFASQPVRWGPIQCSTCTQLQMPYPNPATEAILKTFVSDPYPNQLDFFTRKVETGDVVTVCTSSVCVDYQLNYSGKFEGVQSRPVQNVGGGGGSGGNGNGGGGSGGGGGYIGGGSGGGSGGDGGGSGGVVVVGPPKNAN